MKESLRRVRQTLRMSRKSCRAADILESMMPSPGLRSAAFIAGLMSLPVPVAAADMTPLQAAAYQEYERCAEGRAMGHYDYGLQACLDADGALAGLIAANPVVPDYERDFLLFTKATVELSVGGAYGAIDGVRSARVCEKSEQSWATAGQIPADSPFSDSVRRTEQGSIDTIRLCRNEQGTPAWGRPLP